MAIYGYEAMNYQLKNNKLPNKNNGAA